MLLLRSLAFNVFLYGFTAISSVIAMTLALILPSRLPGFARWWSRTWLAAYEMLCGVSYEVLGRENMPDGSCIIAMKHQSTWDTFALFAVFREPVLVFKRELTWIPIFGWALLRMGCIPVKRGSGKTAVDSMIRGAAVAFKRNKQVVIFPEGTRSSVGQPAVYKTGVSHLYEALHVACVPVAVNSGDLWPRRKLLRPRGVIKLEILPPIQPGMPRKQMLAMLKEQIETTSQRLSVNAKDPIQAPSTHMTRS
jgi:1-acyl-sn-glycerol-3-phosphate acyltransferase